MCHLRDQRSSRSRQLLIWLGHKDLLISPFEALKLLS